MLLFLQSVEMQAEPLTYNFQLLNNHKSQTKKLIQEQKLILKEEVKVCEAYMNTNKYQLKEFSISSRKIAPMSSHDEYECFRCS